MDFLTENKNKTKCADSIVGSSFNFVIFKKLFEILVAAFKRKKVFLK